MAASSIPSEKKKALLRFKQSLEDLTFNSKPLIDDLTRAADSYKMFAAQIVEMIESRIMQVRVDWKLPSLYLLDSILKNLAASYKEEISRIIVGVFCHCFEKLVEPDVRKALHKLRLTWSPFVPTRKLAAIDRHVHALDPNWPVIAMDVPPSPTIFVNPIFLEPTDNATKGQSTHKSASPVKNLGEKNRQTDTKRGKSLTVSSISKTSKNLGEKNRQTDTKRGKSPAVTSISKTSVKVTKKVKSPPTAKPDEPTGPLSIQERRNRILEDKRKQRMEQQRVLGLGPGSSSSKTTATTDQTKEDSATSVHVSKVQSGAKAKASTPPTSRNFSPSSTARRKGGRTRSVSPFPPASGRGRRIANKPSAVNHTGRGSPRKGAKHKQAAGDDSVPPTEKRPRLETDDVDAEMVEIEESKDAASNDLPIKKPQLELDDLPPQLLSKHHDLILEKMKNHLISGGLSSEHHQIIISQIDELYKLQKLKENADRSSPQQDERREPSPKTETPSTSSQDNRESSSVLSTQTLPPNSNGFGISSESNTSRGHFHPYTSGGPATSSFNHPPPHEDSRYHPSQRGYRSRRGFRPWRGPPPRRGRPREWYPNDVPPADMFPPRRVLPGPPPPRLQSQWHEPMDIDQGPVHPSRPPPVSSSAASLPVSELFSKLVATGIIGDGPRVSQMHPVDAAPGMSGGGPEQIESIPLNIPNLSLTPATLKQRYGALISLLNAGEPCTSCGLRFTSRSGEAYRKHLDWHFKMNRKESEGLTRTSRNWFIHPEDWLTFEELTEDNEDKDTSLKPLVTESESREQSEQPTEEEVVSCQVLPGEGNEVCWICQEPFEQFWEEEEEEWHFKDALRNDGKPYHTFCYKDAKESGSLDGSLSQLPSPVEVKQEPLTSSL